jgi:hypothetical protein
VFRHKFDPSSPVAGILFLGFALRYLNAGLGGHPVPYIWTMPAALATIAIIILLRLLFLRRRREP